MHAKILALCGFAALAFAQAPHGNNGDHGKSGAQVSSQAASSAMNSRAGSRANCHLSQGQQQQCLDNAAAQKVAENFRTLITNYSNQSAAAFLAPEFVDYSDGVNTLVNKGCPKGPETLGQPTFTSLQDFQAGQGSQPNIPFTILNVWNNCDSVTMRWQSPQPSNDVQPVQPVTGILVMEVCPNGGQEPWIIDTVYSEFNSGAWLYDLGIFKPSC